MNDNAFKEKQLSKIKDVDNAKVQIIEEANHDLEKADFRESLSFFV